MSPVSQFPEPETTTTQLVRLEAMLIAQRKLLLRLIAQTGAGAAIADDLAAREVFQGHEEDPGVLPTAEFALEAAVAEQLRLIAREVQAIAEAAGPAPVAPAAG
ncbi:hypothetical protein [Frigidibacter sp.]|uniref:hypothetical protein n=1 Tax=Frigidibacter sp. TaxID=2586418 RepID=UPI0027340DEB|nr:hypothetical protein [Frigidibacter sp.]MDP3339682.1 hypothetical protein [Frigidibacter sp.]